MHANGPQPTMYNNGGMYGMPGPSSSSMAASSGHGHAQPMPSGSMSKPFERSIMGSFNGSECEVLPIAQHQHKDDCPVALAKQKNYSTIGGSSSGSNSNNSNSASTSQPGPSRSSTSTSSAMLDPIKVNRKPNCLSKCIDCSVGCEVEFPLDAIACIFDCLTEASLIPEAVTVQMNEMSRMAYDAGNGGAVGGGPGGNGSGTAAPEDVNIIAPKYRHLPIADSADKQETYLTLAFEAAILALSKQRIMPHGLYAQHVICKQQDQLIQRLRSIDLDSVLVGVLRKLSVQLLDGGPTSGLGEMIHPESVPMHTLARFLFASLLNQHSDLAFEIGLRAMRFPILENINEGASVNGIELQHNNFMHSPYPRWWTLGHLETQQCSLSSTMLSAAKGDTKRLSAVLQNARRNIHSSSHLFKVRFGEMN